MVQQNDPGVDDKFYRFKSFRVPKYRIKFESAGKLADIGGYTWYTPASLYLWGQFTETNLAEIISREDIKVFWYKFDKPIFSHFGNDWDHILWAAADEDWPKIVEGVLETVQFDIPNKLLYQYALQKLTILDPLTVDKDRVVLSTTPHSQVHAFAVLSNQSQFAFDAKAGVVAGSRPGMRTYKPQSSHVRAADMLFRGSNLTQDDAFQRYKKIMETLEDAAHGVSSQQAYEERLKRERRS